MFIVAQVMSSSEWLNIIARSELQRHKFQVRAAELSLLADCEGRS